jgi:2-haloacid dehalogenase
VTANDRWATFDCYGTLVDWEVGIGTVLADLWPDAGLERLLERYHAIEPEIEQDSDLPYREVLSRSLRRLADDEGLSIPVGRENALADSLPEWPVFGEVPGALSELRLRGWKTAILSNTDPDLLDASMKAIGVPFDMTVTAREAGSYKPAHGHWKRFFELTGADRDRHVHVAASLFHDISPAEEMGLRSVWINRLQEVTNLPRDAELSELSELPEVLERLVPAEG